MPKPAPAASNWVKAAPSEVQSSHQPLLTSPEKNPSISDIKKNFLLSSALGREQIRSRIQPVKGSLKHCGQDPRTTHRPSGGCQGDSITVTSSSHMQTISTRTRFPSTDQEHPPVSLGEPWVRLEPPPLVCSSKTRALEGQAAAPRQPLPPSPLSCPGQAFHSIPVSQGLRESRGWLQNPKSSRK